MSSASSMGSAARPLAGERDRLIRFGYKLPNCGGVLCDPRWATRATIEDFAETAVELGYESLWLHDHLVTPGELQHIKEPAFYDPVVAAAYLLAKFPRVVVGVAAIQVPLRDPVVLAKQLTTLAAIAPGRFIAGLGLGRYESEYLSVGHDFYERRGGVANNYLEIIRALLTEDRATISGQHRTVSNAQMYPKPGPHDLPLWIAGNSLPAIKRAARFGDGWIAAAMTPDDPGAACQVLRTELSRRQRGDANPRVALSLTIDPDGVSAARAEKANLHRHPLAAKGDAGTVAQTLDAYASAGATDFLLSLPGNSVVEVKDHMRWFASDVRPRVVG